MEEFRPLYNPDSIQISHWQLPNVRVLLCSYPLFRGRYFSLWLNLDTIERGKLWPKYKKKKSIKYLNNLPPQLSSKKNPERFIKRLPNMDGWLTKPWTRTQVFLPLVLCPLWLFIYKFLHTAVQDTVRIKACDFKELKFYFTEQEPMKTMIIIIYDK